MAGRVRVVSPQALRVQLSAASRAAQKELGEAILREANAQVPVDPDHNDARGPHLRDSGFVEQDDAVTRVGYTQFYGRFLELGTKHIAARPFLRPAALKARRLR